MAYNKQNFEADDYLRAEQLNAMDDQIAANEAAISSKQNELISGTNIKTINGKSILGSGDIEIIGGSESIDMSDYIKKGMLSTQEGKYSTALGFGTTTSGTASFAAGSNNTASGEYSTAVCSNNKASGDSSFAAGSNNTASGDSSIVLGNASKASGDSSIVLGNTSVATHENAKIIGTSCLSSNDYQIVLGRYNEGKDDTALELGWGDGSGADNGTDTETTRNNIFEVKKSGIISSYGVKIKDKKDSNGAHISCLSNSSGSTCKLMFYNDIVPAKHQFVNIGDPGLGFNEVWATNFKGNADSADKVNNALTIKSGDTTITYDGSAAKSITITGGTGESGGAIDLSDYVKVGDFNAKIINYDGQFVAINDSLDAQLEIINNNNTTVNNGLTAVNANVGELNNWKTSTDGTLTTLSKDAKNAVIAAGAASIAADEAKSAAKAAQDNITTLGNTLTNNYALKSSVPVSTKDLIPENLFAHTNVSYKFSKGSGNQITELEREKYLTYGNSGSVWFGPNTNAVQAAVTLANSDITSVTIQKCTNPVWTVRYDSVSKIIDIRNSTSILGEGDVYMEITKSGTKYNVVLPLRFNGNFKPVAS